MPKGDASLILKTYHGSGFIFLCQGNLLLNPNLIEIPQSLVIKHLSQNSCPFAVYVAEVIFYYNMLEFI